MDDTPLYKKGHPPRGSNHTSFSLPFLSRRLCRSPPALLMGNCCCRCASTHSTTDIFTRDEPTKAVTHTSNDGASSSAGNCRLAEASSSESPFPDGQILTTPNLKFFSFSDLLTATQNFNSENVLGRGAFGTVFKGMLDEKTLGPCEAGTGMPVAIKKLKAGSLQGFKEYQAEKAILGRRSHPNLVKLLGCCWEDVQMHLVYEYMQKGSLDDHLFGNTTHPEDLSWQRRLKIAMGAARGLVFLHSSDEQVIYRDFKTSNILLDGDYNAKISDFGLARLGPSGAASHVTTSAKGTNGYVAPEYLETGHLYVKSDVYSFGVVLLEMLTGFRALDNERPAGQEDLVSWATPSLSSMTELKTIMDSRLEGQYSDNAAMEAAQLTLQCLQSHPKARPSMKEVLEALEKIEALSINQEC